MVDEPMYPWKRSYPRIESNTIYTLVFFLVFVAIIIIYLMMQG